jgi:thiol-disulfide isomerase/thioredoxin
MTVSLLNPATARILCLLVLWTGVAGAAGPTAASSTGDSGARWAELDAGLAVRASGPERDAQWVRNATLAWELYLANPGDARRWAAWDSLLRSRPRFADNPEAGRVWTEREARIEADLQQTSDGPVALRELFAGRKVSALVLPYTSGTLPADWQTKLVPPIEALAAAFPEGTGAFVYFARLVSAVESQDPAAMPALVARMEASPNARVRELGSKRRSVLQALAEPLDLTLPLLGGGSLDTRSWRGRVVLVDYWATWCVPCVEAMPKLKELYSRYHGEGLEIVGISMDQAAARGALESLVAKLELPWPQVFDGKGPQTPAAVRYGVQPIPHVLLADRSGRIIAVNPRSEQLEPLIRRLLAEAR